MYVYTDIQEEPKGGGSMKEKEYIFCEVADERAGRESILIVDDDIEMLKIFRFYLQDKYDVSVVNSGKAAMTLLSNYVPDVILLDYMMPDCNGAEVLRYMKDAEKTRNIPVIFLTGVTDEDTIKECLSYHPADYIVKPIAKGALLNKLEMFFKTFGR